MDSKYPSNEPLISTTHIVRGTQQENVGKILETSFSAFYIRLFQKFLMEYLCKLIQVDLFGVFS